MSAFGCSVLKDETVYIAQDRVRWGFFGHIRRKVERHTLRASHQNATAPPLSCRPRTHRQKPQIPAYARRSPQRHSGAAGIGAPYGRYYAMRTRRADKHKATVRAAYVEALQKLASHKAASAAVGVHYTTSWKWRKNEADFAEACDRALGRSYGELLAVARKLAIEGLVVETFDKAGNVVSRKRVYSERILLKFLAKLDPAGWSDKVQLDSKSTVEIRDKRIRAEDMTPGQRRAAREFLATLPDDVSRN